MTTTKWDVITSGMQRWFNKKKNDRYNTSLTGCRLTPASSQLLQQEQWNKFSTWQAGNRRKLPGHVESMQEEPTVGVLLHGDADSFPSGPESRKSCPGPPCPLSVVLHHLLRDWMRREVKGLQTGKDSVKLSLLTSDMTYIKKALRIKNEKENN